jgi:hypothetical protein
MIDAPLLTDIGRTARSVALAVLPLGATFIAFQVLFLRLPRREVLRILTGTLVAAAGLFLFLLGVGIGFLPFGRAIGEAAGSLPERWLLLPFGAALGFVTAWSEPAVRILADQVEEASTGSIRVPVVVAAISLGAAVATALGMFRIGFGIPLLWLIVPGYVIVLAIVGLSDKGFVSIALDASGVTTGPLTNTFLLALAFGASSVMEGQNPLVEGLGLVSLVSLAPMISVMTLGLLIRWKARGKEARP